MLRTLGIYTATRPADAERPDFIVTLPNGTRVGIEVVRALDPHTAKASGGLRRLSAEVRQGLTRAGVLACVEMRIDEEAAADLSIAPDLLRAEAAAVVLLTTSVLGSEDVLQNGEWRRFCQIDRSYEKMMGHRRLHQRGLGDLQGTGVRHLDAVSIRRHTKVVAGCTVFGRGRGAEIVQAAIDEKARLLAGYRDCGADAIWLLVVGSSGIGGALSVAQVKGVTFHSPFDRTLFLELFMRRCIDLETKRADVV